VTLHKDKFKEFGVLAVDGYYYIDGYFEFFYGDKYLVLNDKSLIRILIFNHDQMI